MLPKIKYLLVQDILAKQKEFALKKIRKFSKSHIIHKGIEEFGNAPEGFQIDYMNVPGLGECFSKLF